MPYLPEAVESILRQSYTGFTFIIVNDGSGDGSETYLRSLRDNRIVLIEQQNQGPGAARSRALGLCRSEYVALMDADDISLPHRLRSEVEYLDAHPEVVILGTQIEFLIGRAVQPALRAPAGHAEIEARFMNGQAGLCNPSVMFRSAAAAACASYPSHLLGEDIDFCLNMCDQGRAANINQVLLQYRLHVNQTSISRCREMVYSGAFAAHRAVCRRKGLAPPELDAFLRSASFVDRLRWSLEAWTQIQYRTGRIQLACGKPVRGFLRLAMLGISRPFATSRRLVQAFAAFYSHAFAHPSQIDNG
jgi:glycosyltransferase involved in cell wall biosynthesis